MNISLKLVILLLLFVANYATAFDFTTPFKWQAKIDNKQIVVTVKIPAAHYLYVKSTKVSAINGQGMTLQPLSSPVKTVHEDQFAGKVAVYQGGKSAIWVFATDTAGPYKITINSQGCRDKTATENAVCFMPEHKVFELGGVADDNPPMTKTVKSLSSGKFATLFTLLNRFAKRRSASGYLGADDFLAFMNDQGGRQPENFLAGKSIWLVILLVIIGGIGLNFTPCVLPMIPVNLAIIGAGTGADSNKRGFWLGSAYGIGIAVAYGVLGISVVLAGAQFGALNSTIWFNLSIAIIFLILALAMFDLFNIDLSRFGGSAGALSKQRGKLVTALIMGIIAALLAGACVAPVVIAVLLYSARVYGEGNWLGLALPFLLGSGMGLPWPFAGAGMAIIPKPGQWMVRIKQAFGVIILLAGAYYGYIAYSLISFSSGDVGTGKAQLATLQAAIAAAETNHKPILIDFWATWCKNCSKMESTTFKNRQVKKRLADFIVVKFQAENLNAPATAAVTKYFKLKGLPTYIILEKFE